MTSRPAILPLFAAAALSPATALAHTGVGEASGFMHGFAHPVGGLDHLLAMVAVGLLAWQLGGRALWMVPLAFVAAMAAGGAAGVAAIEVPVVEVGIALSVVVLGAVVAVGARAPLAAVMAIAAAFAVFHGHAHGAEMPEDVGGLAYGAGFVLATALLHLAGIGAGYGTGRLAERLSPLLVRVAGGLVAIAGLGVLA